MICSALFSDLVLFKYIFFQGKTFEVPAGSLAFSVVVYTICSIVTLALLVVRRNVSIFGKAELGGPHVPKLISGLFMIFLWFLYVLISSLQSYEHIPGFQKKRSKKNRDNGTFVISVNSLDILKPEKNLDQLLDQ